MTIIYIFNLDYLIHIYDVLCNDAFLKIPICIDLYSCKDDIDILEDVFSLNLSTYEQDQFLKAAPLTGGMGAQLMQKMGWREGEGLGKNKNGTVEPIVVDFKTDRKGLVAEGEKAQKKLGNFPALKDLSGKHPVSALMEICNKRKWAPPDFLMIRDSGPDHCKHFLFKVLINGTEYKPNLASPNKKHAKASAATTALQALGLVPKESVISTTNFKNASDAST